MKIVYTMYIDGCCLLVAKQQPLPCSSERVLTPMIFWWPPLCMNTDLLERDWVVAACFERCRRVAEMMAWWDERLLSPRYVHRWLLVSSSPKRLECVVYPERISLHEPDLADMAPLRASRRYAHRRLLELVCSGNVGQGLRF